MSDAMHDFVDAPSMETLASLEKGLRSRTLELAGAVCEESGKKACPRLRDSRVSTRQWAIAGLGI